MVLLVVLTWQELNRAYIPTCKVHSVTISNPIVFFIYLKYLLDIQISFIGIRRDKRICSKETTKHGTILQFNQDILFIQV